MTPEQKAYYETVDKDSSRWIGARCLHAEPCVWHGQRKPWPN